jgi:hypothetical protein
MKLKASEKSKINRELGKLTFNKYFPEIPLRCLATILNSFGLNTNFLDGIYCGRAGETNEEISGTNVFFRMTWYKMESGRYEIVCYVS